jgi:hypothetical protein
MPMLWRVASSQRCQRQLGARPYWTARRQIPARNRSQTLCPLLQRRAALRPRMQTRRRDVGVPQGLLHLGERRAVVDGARPVRVPQPRWRDRRLVPQERGSASGKPGAELILGPIGTSRGLRSACRDIIRSARAECAKNDPGKCSSIHQQTRIWRSKREPRRAQVKVRFRSTNWVGEKPLSVLRDVNMASMERRSVHALKATLDCTQLYLR